jgi:hypothetical protein
MRWPWETTSVMVASATGFAAGDLALIDPQDTSEVSEGDCTTKWAGIEDVLVQGGRPGGYAGQSAGGIESCSL